MPEFIYQLSSFPLFLLFIASLVLISVISITLTHRFIPLHFRCSENTAIISCSALLGVTYAILIGFTILFQLSTFDKANTAENLEGQSLYTIYRSTQDLPAPSATRIRDLIVSYAHNTIDKEWPAMNMGNKADRKGNDLILNIVKEIRAIKSSKLTNAAASALNDISVATNMLFELHSERILKVSSTLNGHIWFVILLTTFLTLGINYLLGMEYLLHICCITLICIMISAIMYLIVSLDRPYQGDFMVKPETIKLTLESITS